MNPRKPLVLGITALLSTACVVSNPTPATHPQGVRIRVTSAQAGPMPLVGTLIYAEADTLRLYVTRMRSVVLVPVASITRLEIYRGRMGSVGGTVKGAGIGAIAGAAAGIVIGATTEATFGGMFGSERDYGEAIAETATEMAVTGALLGGMAGATVGNAVWQETTVHALREELCHCRILRPMSQR